jgi:hypothetical protein
LRTEMDIVLLVANVPAAASCSKLLVGFDQVRLISIAKQGVCLASNVIAKLKAVSARRDRENMQPCVWRHAGHLLHNLLQSRCNADRRIVCAEVVRPSQQYDVTRSDTGVRQ